MPVVFSLLYVHSFGVNVILRDQWEVANLFSKLSRGNLSLSDLWVPHNEHRFFFPRIVMLALGTATRWNTIAEMYFIQACLLTTLTALFFAFKASPMVRTILFIPVAFLIFSLRQRTDLLWGYQITFAMTQAFGILALFALHASRHNRRRGLAFMGALACATIATGSSIQGLLVWPAGLVQLLLISGWKQPYRGMLILWTSVGIGQWIFYFVGYEPRGRSPGGLTSLLREPASAVQNFLAVVGNALFSGWGAALLTGALLFCLIGIVVYLITDSPEGLSENAFWLSSLVFFLLVSLAITVGRIELDTNNALASRYTIFSLPAVASVYAMLAKLLTEHRSRLAVATFSLMVVLVSLSVVVSYKNAVPLGARERSVSEMAANVLRDYENRPDRQLTLLYNKHPETVRRRAPILDRLDYNVFAPRLERSY
jgi:hypothetical protein